MFVDSTSADDSCRTCCQVADMRGVREVLKQGELVHMITHPSCQNNGPKTKGVILLLRLILVIGCYFCCPPYVDDVDSLDRTVVSLLLAICVTLFPL